MNYEEMLENREGVATHREELPLGTFYKKLIDKKYRNVLSLRPELTDSIAFCEGLRVDAEFCQQLNHPNQLCFEMIEDSGGVYELELEQGSYQSYHQLLTQNPAVVTGKDYIDKVVELMASMLKQLHQYRVFQCCLAPEFLFVRKSDNMPLLLCHGSVFKAVSNQSMIYKGVEEYVAPEVLNGGVPDECADVYALGMFIKRLHADSSMSLEYKHVVATATSPNPADRYATIDQLLAAVAQKRSIRRSALALLTAVVIGLLCVAIYIDMVPQTVDVEFVKPVVEEKLDPYESGLTPAELGLDSNDSVYMSEEDKAEQAEIDAEIERIFRRQFTREAEATLSKIYSQEHMNSSEQTFINNNNTLMEELFRKRDALAAQAGMDALKADGIASDIINRIRAQKQKKQKSLGFQQRSSEE